MSSTAIRNWEIAGSEENSSYTDIDFRKAQTITEGNNDMPAQPSKRNRRGRRKTPKKSRLVTNLPKCKATGKLRFVSKGFALGVIASASRKGNDHTVPVRSYRCSDCGDFHLTSRF